MATAPSAKQSVQDEAENAEMRQLTRDPPLLLRFVLSGVAAGCAETVTFPVDLTKTRLQLQGQQAESGILGRQPKLSAWGVVRRLVVQEGWQGLYNGVRPAVARHLIYSPIRMTVYQFLRNSVSSEEEKRTGELALWKMMASGALSGAIGQYVVTPCDLMKVRMQADGRLVAAGHPPRYGRSLVGAVRTIIRQEGFRALWQGWGPSVQRATITNLVEVPAYEYSRRLLVHHQILEEGQTLNFVCAALCSFFACFVSTPVDVTKSRLMNQNSVSPMYSSAADCAIKTVRSEGITALWKGFLVQWMRFGPWSVVFWMTFENLRSQWERMAFS